MVYIPFPRVDLNNHADLVAWRTKIGADKNVDWGTLKRDFLPAQTRFVNGIHPIPKCWFSELPQGDTWAQDVEHFRPKKSAIPLNNVGKTQWKNTIDKKIGFPIYQDNSSSAYPWLEFDYRNYRFVTAKTNRSGGKHEYFPIPLNGTRLSSAQVPWATVEYCFLLDPTDPHDAQQLWVLPNGQIRPKAPKPATVPPSEYTNFNTTWTDDKFNYIRAWVTISLYRLEEKILIQGRKEIYTQTQENINRLVRYGLIKQDNDFIKDYVQQIYQAMLPSAPFALAARCALTTYTPPPELQPQLTSILNRIISNLQEKINNIHQTPISWSNP